MSNQLPYTPEQISDITARESKGLEALKELGLTPAAAVQKTRIVTNTGEEMWVDKITPFLQDTKYAPVRVEPKDLK